CGGREHSPGQGDPSVGRGNEHGTSWRWGHVRRKSCDSRGISRQGGHHRIHRYRPGAQPDCIEGGRKMTGRAAAAAISSLSLPTLALYIAIGPFRSSRSITPDADREFTSSRQITCLAISPTGEVWAGTTGGLLHRTTDGKWRKFGRQDGLPSNEVR